MPFVNNTGSGWAVVRSDGHVVGTYPSEEEANARAQEMGDGHEVKYGRSTGGDFDEAL